MSAQSTITMTAPANGELRQVPVREFFVACLKLAPENGRLYRPIHEGDPEIQKLAQIIAWLPDGAILLCYEADWNDCHRKILADYLDEHRLAQVSEFQRPPKRSVLQMLFNFWL